MEKLVIAGREFNSRLFLGTGKFNNNQLMAVIKQCGGFKDRYESRVKMDGKVFAIKTEMGNRTAYGLIHVINQYGTTGENGYLRIKLKVTGVDGNGDGLPDAGQYIRN